MRSRLFCIQILGLCMLARTAFTAEDAQKPAGFTKAVIAKAIAFMPNDLQAHLKACEQAISATAKEDPSKPSVELCYFVSKEEGTGLAVFAERFRQARKAVGKGKTISAMASHLGQLARCAIALSQPYRTDEAALKSRERLSFEQKLNLQSAPLKAEFDGYRKVDNPSEFALEIAKKANAELKKLSAGRDGEGRKTAEVPPMVFALASNALADVWWSLLAKPGKTSGDNATGTESAGNYIGNKRSLKFHLPSCRYQPAQKNRIYFSTREQAIAEGFVPCKVCKP